MSRPLRIRIEGGRYRVTARGHHRRNIGRDLPGRRHVLEWLDEMTGRHRVEVHASVPLRAGCQQRGIGVALPRKG